MGKIVIRELKTFQQMSAIFPLIHQLNPDIEKKSFGQRLHKMRKEGYRCIGAYNKDKKLIACAGFWIGNRFWCGTFIEPDNVVVERAHRGMGIGDKLMDWIEMEGKRKKCKIIKLEAYAVNTAARKFYATRSYEEPGLVIVKPLSISLSEWHEQLKAKAK